jgi:hypothetical protein
MAEKTLNVLLCSLAKDLTSETSTSVSCRSVFQRHDTDVTSFWFGEKKERYKHFHPSALNSEANLEGSYLAKKHS